MRLFVGIALPADIHDRLDALQSGLPGARWVALEGAHITLRFIGETDGGRAQDIDEALADIQARAFELRLSGIGNFGSGRKMRAVWAGLDRSEALIHLADKVESAIVRAGFEPERRKFTPHVTLARLDGAPVEAVAEYIQRHNTFSAGPFPIDQFTLFRSFIGKDGSRYQALADYPLVGGVA